MCKNGGSYFDDSLQRKKLVKNVMVEKGTPEKQILQIAKEQIKKQG
ncbi:hypothetical protein [Neobacillus vireti]